MKQQNFAITNFLSDLYGANEAMMFLPEDVIFVKASARLHHIIIMRDGHLAANYNILACMDYKTNKIFWTLMVDDKDVTLSRDKLVNVFNNDLEYITLIDIQKSLYCYLNVNVNDFFKESHRHIPMYIGFFTNKNYIGHMCTPTIMPMNNIYTDCDPSIDSIQEVINRFYYELSFLNKENNISLMPRYFQTAAKNLAIEFMNLSDQYIMWPTVEQF